jgi:hypothetical protein
MGNDKRENTTQSPEDAVVDKDKILKYMEQLGKAVTDCLNDSKEVKSMIKLLEEIGLNLNLSFVAMISGAKPLAFPVSWAGPTRELKFEITPEDRAFLQSLGIKYDESGEDTREMEQDSGATNADDTGSYDRDGIDEEEE